MRKALSVYAAHYIMTRHLCLTPRSKSILQEANFWHGGESNFTTSRVLNRQIKAVIDELLIQSVQDLFYEFTKSLKSKSRHEWAPCLAAFLVLCLFMETVESTVDTFVVARNERSMQQRCAPEFKRDLALSINREVENLPFKQFAFQFHQIYQTHPKDAAAKEGSSKAYNPLVDNALARELKQDNDAAYEMVCSLQQLLEDSECCPTETNMNAARIDQLTAHRDRATKPSQPNFNRSGRSPVPSGHISGLYRSPNC